jgi:hypothetical protein
MREPSSSAASAPGITQGRELSATELIALRLRRQRDVAMALAVVAGLALFGSMSESFYAWTHQRVVVAYHACPECLPPPPPPPPSASLVPDYVPTGEHAQLKQDFARFVDVYDADHAAAWLDDQLDREIWRRERALLDETRARR